MMKKEISLKIILLFFVLLSSFALPSCIQKTPVKVITPPAVSEEKAPIENMITILVKSTDNDAKSPQGQIFLSFVGADTSSSEMLRKKILVKALDIYNSEGEGRLLPDTKKLKLTDTQQDTFAKFNSFGLSFSELCDILEKNGNDLNDSMNKFGVPIDNTVDMNNLNEFQIWMKAVKCIVEELGLEADDLFVEQSENSDFCEKINSGTGIAIKADKETPFPVINMVFENLRFVGLNKFTLMTALKEEK